MSPARSLAPRGVAALALVLQACAATTPASAPVDSARLTTAPLATHSSPAPVLPRRVPARFDAANALADVRVLAAEIGPREAASAAYRAAVRFVEARLRDLGYRVRRQRVRVPAGRTVGRPVPAGWTWNVVADPQGPEPQARHVLVAAHLDTVPGSPGANDNASGVAVILELARLAALHAPATPLRFVAFGGEERRQPGTDGNHFGSRAFAASLGQAERRALGGMVAIDMVGTGAVVLLCTGGRSPGTLVEAFLRRAEGLGVPARRCPRPTRLSDHWSFEERGVTVAWVWGGSHPAYHSPRDRVGVLERAQLLRVGRLAWETLRTYR